MSGDCTCCTTPPAQIAAEIENRPGLSAIAYRTGTFGSFRRAIIDELARVEALKGLTARAPDDYTITAIELWSAVADVLTFYQERTANEAFLRTATLRDSVLRLVRLIGYELRPGAAATTQLAFTLDAGATALIPPGTRVQSIPGEGETPQVFETLLPVAADARLNRLRVLPTPVPAAPTGAGSRSAIVAPDPASLTAAARLARGDRLLLYAPSAVEELTLSEVRSSDDMLVLDWSTPLKSNAYATAFTGDDPQYRVYTLGRSFQLFGVSAPATMVVAQQKVAGDLSTTFLTQAATDYTLHGDGSGPDQISLDARHENLKPGGAVLAVAHNAAGTVAIPFEITTVAVTQVSRSANPPTGAAVVAQTGTVTQLTLSPMPATGGAPLANLFSGSSDIRDVVVHELLGPPLRFWPHAYGDTITADDVYLPGRRSGWSSIEVGRTIEKGATKPGTVVDLSALESGREVLLADSTGGPPVHAALRAAAIVGAGVELGPTSSDPDTVSKLGLAGDQTDPITVLVSDELPATLTLPHPRRELTITIGTLPTQTIVLDATTIAAGAIADVAGALEAAIRAALPGAPTFARALAWVLDGAIVVAPGIPGDRVALAASRNDADTVVALGLDGPRARFLDGLTSAPIEPTTAAVSGSVRVAIGIDPPEDQPVTVALPSAASLAAAIAPAFGVHAKVTADDRVIVLPPLPRYEQREFIRLQLDTDGPPALAIATAVLLGNVAWASHGQTIHGEVLGDGDASQAFQRFALKKKPVTFVPAATPGGVASSLQLLVDRVRWTERSTLLDAGRDDRVYVTRIADDGTLSVQFGDGVTGSRLPSGRQNVVARYRQGIGVAGRVGAGRLATLIDRPTGVKSAINLLGADGGADPETMVRAREAAPGTVRTFGRAVSLRDFEDTALMAGEVAKASATWVWTGEHRAIHLTVAAQEGGTFSADGLSRLAATLATERDPNHKLLIANYSPVPVSVDASILVDDQHVTADVLTTARTTLLDELAIDQRELAEPVYLSDIFRILQDVEGVVAVDVNALDLKNTDAGFRAAHGIDDTLGQPQPHLLMLPARPIAGSGTVLAAELVWLEAPADDVTIRASGGLSL